jgi:hypothetical protein
LALAQLAESRAKVALQPTVIEFMPNIGAEAGAINVPNNLVYLPIRIRLPEAYNSDSAE